MIVGDDQPMDKIVFLDEFKKLMEQKNQITDAEIAEAWLKYLNKHTLEHVNIRNRVFDMIKEPIKDFITLYNAESLKYEYAIGHEPDYESMGKQLEFIGKYSAGFMDIIEKFSGELISYAENNVLEFYKMIKTEEGEE